MAGMLERRGRILDPAGRMWSVLTLSPSLMRTGALIVCASGWPRGSGLMFGPRAVCTLGPVPGGGVVRAAAVVAPGGGAGPMPIHGPQADSRMRAPDSIRSARAPVRAIIVNTWREPGVTVMLRPGLTLRHFRTAALTARSW